MSAADVQRTYAEVLELLAKPAPAVLPGQTALVDAADVEPAAPLQLDIFGLLEVGQ